MYIPTAPEKEVINIMSAEASEWKDGEAFVTNKVSYKMLGSDGIIQKCRKNYLGKFDNERDELTGKKKIFVPLTEDMTETVLKNIDLDSVDINIRATNPNGFSSALILRYLINYFMRRNYFGEILNNLLRQFCVDGTVVLKAVKDKGKINTPIPDITNFLIDPSEDDVYGAGGVIERNVLKLSEAQKYPWDNLEYLKGDGEVEKLYGIQKNTKTQVPYVEVYERWGDLPLYCITGKEGDKEKWVPAVAVVSNLFKEPIVHKVALNKKSIKPYEECRFRKIMGRWHGRGIGELLLPLQSYINETVNLRLNYSRLSQTGLFKVRKGSGITQQLLSSLATGGVVPVTRMDDIDEIRKSDVPPSSYRDEQQIYNWAQRSVGAWEISRGEMLPSSMPATTAVIQEKASRSGYDLLQQNLGIFLSKVFERHLIPLLLETLKDEEVVSIVGSPKELKEIDENFINSEINRHIVGSMASGKGIPKPEFVEHLKKMYRENLKHFQKTRYFKIKKQLLKQYQYETEVFVTGESFNKAVMVRQLNELLLTYSRLPGLNLDVDAVAKEVFDLMGLGGARFLKSQDEIQASPPLEVPTPQQARPFQETEMAGEAGTMERTGRGGIR